MDDDFFKDLVPIKASPAQRSVSNNVETSSIFSDDVLSAVPDTRPAVEPNQKGSNDTFPQPMTSPMGDPKQKKEVREMEKAMQAMLESTFKRFAGGLQKVLEDVQQCDSAPHIRSLASWHTSRRLERSIFYSVLCECCTSLS